MAILNPRLAPQITALAPQLTALRCAFLIAAHHKMHLAPEGLPALVEGDMSGSVRRALAQAGFRVKVLSRCGR